MGIKEIIVAVNKLDLVTNEKEKFKKIRKVIRKKLKQYSIYRKYCKFIPISGLKGVNLTTKGYPWYNGPCLFDIMKNLKIHDRHVDKPLRLSISNAFIGSIQKGKQQVNGFLITGKIETGYVKKGKIYTIMPMDSKIKVKDLFFNSKSYDYGFAG